MVVANNYVRCEVSFVPNVLDKFRNYPSDVSDRIHKMLVHLLTPPVVALNDEVHLVNHIRRFL